MQLGFIGLGKMGSRMATKLLADKHSLVVWNRSEQAILNFKNQISPIRQAQGKNFKFLKEDLKIAKTIEELVKSLDKPRIIWMMLPAGEATESVLSLIVQCTQPNDIVIDGGNAYYKDTERRFKDLKNKGIRYLGIGVSGGLLAFDNGYPLMVGGDKQAYEDIKPLLESLAKPARHASKALRTGPHGGHAYFGEGGAGHFVKMVHNGIEYGMMQALGEGFGVLEKAPYQFDLVAVAKLWQKGTIVSSFLVDRAKDALEKNVKLSDIEGVIAESGEAKWTVEQAKEEGVPIENIEQSLDFRKRSQTDKKVSDSFAARMVAALRREFGGHEVKKKNP